MCFVWRSDSFVVMSLAGCWLSIAFYVGVKYTSALDFENRTYLLMVIYSGPCLVAHRWCAHSYRIYIGCNGLVPVVLCQLRASSIEYVSREREREEKSTRGMREWMGGFAIQIYTISIFCHSSPFIVRMKLIIDIRDYFNCCLHDICLQLPHPIPFIR